MQQGSRTLVGLEVDDLDEESLADKVRMGLSPDLEENFGGLEQGSFRPEQETGIGGEEGSSYLSSEGRAPGNMGNLQISDKLRLLGEEDDQESVKDAGRRPPAGEGVEGLGVEEDRPGLAPQLEGLEKVSRTAQRDVAPPDET